MFLVCVIILYCVGLVFLVSKYRNNVLLSVKHLYKNIKNRDNKDSSSKTKDDQQNPDDNNNDTNDDKEIKTVLDKTIVADTPEKCDYAEQRGDSKIIGQQTYNFDRIFIESPKLEEEVKLLRLEIVKKYAERSENDVTGSINTEIRSDNLDSSLSKNTLLSHTLPNIQPQSHSESVQNERNETDAFPKVQDVNEEKVSKVKKEKKRKTKVYWEELTAQLIPCKKCKRNILSHRIQRHEELCRKK